VEERLGYLAGLLENTEDAVVAIDERYFLTAWNKVPRRFTAGGRKRSWVATLTTWLERT
jgi:hypothetical protein